MGITPASSALEAVAFGIPDEKYGEAVAAAVVVHKGTTPDELRAHVAERLASFKVLAAIHLVEAIPRTATGKVRRRNVRGGFRCQGVGGAALRLTWDYSAGGC
ncbi:MAG: AMP-binding enzyme [Vulcanimicrobiaceae bacterium]